MGIAIGDQVIRDERLRMVRVGVERQNEGRAFLHQPDTGMAATVDPPLMILRLAEPSFQIQVVLRQVRYRACEQSRREAGHQLRQVLRHGVLLPRETPSELLELAMPPLQRAFRRVERVGHCLDLLHVPADFGLVLGDEVQPTVDARR